MVSLDIVSLFTKVPTDETLAVVRDKLAADPLLKEHTCIPIDNLMQILIISVYVEVLRELRKRFHQKRPALFKQGQCHFHQDNAPVHNSILVTNYLTNMGIKTVPHPP